jgi:hypothetical protein
MFNTFSNYTKERRRQGFDDFLKILVTLEPFPSEVAKFLELDDHVWAEAAHMPVKGMLRTSITGEEGAPGRAPGAAPAASSTVSSPIMPGSASASGLASGTEHAKLTRYVHSILLPIMAN